MRDNLYIVNGLFRACIHSDMWVYVWASLWLWKLQLNISISFHHQSIYIAQKMKFSIRDFFSTFGRMCGFGRIYWRGP